MFKFYTSLRVLYNFEEDCITGYTVILFKILQFLHMDIHLVQGGCIGHKCKWIYFHFNQPICTATNEEVDCKQEVYFFKTEEFL